MKLILDGRAGVAILVIALVLSALILFFYWQAPGRQTRKVRLLLIGLRAISLLLVALTLAGSRVQYEKAAPLRVGVRPLTASASSESNNTYQREAAALTRLLRRKNIEATPSESRSIAGAALDAEILLTDGTVDAGSAQNELRAVNAASGGAPVFIVEQTVPGRPRVALESVKINGLPRRGVPLQIQCRVHANQMQGRESLLTISDAAKVQASTSVRWTGNDEWQTVALELVPKVAGWNDYVARIEAPAGGDSKLVSRPFTLPAGEQRIRVLFVEGEPTWEAKFIRRSLEQSNLFAIDYFAQVSRVAAAGEISSGEGKDPSVNDDASALPANLRPEAKLHTVLRNGLNNYELLIAGPMSGATLSASEAANVRAWVERRGGGLIILGGNSFAGSIVAPHGALYELMPAEASPQGFFREAASMPISAGSAGKELKDVGIHLTPTRSAANGMLRAYWEATRTAVPNRVKQLSGDGFRLATLRPGARVLAVSGDIDAVSALNADGSNGSDQTGPPLIAAMRYGAGQVVAFAPADSWRISTGAGENSSGAVRPFDALWQGLALWTSSHAGPAVEISFSSESPGVNEPVTVELQVRDGGFQTVPLARVDASIHRLADDSAGASIPAARDLAQSAEVTPEDRSASPALSSEPGFSPAAMDGTVWQAGFAVPAPGRYRLTVDYSIQGTDNKESSGTFWKDFGAVAASLSSTVSVDTLRRLARESGGDFYSVDNPDLLARRLVQLGQTRGQRTETLELRTWWPLAVIIALLLSTEWLLRRLLIED
ncbi:MAG: hypothetical protein ABI596_00940 [Pyrinomonadaceae bacterium]